MKPTILTPAVLMAATLFAATAAHAQSARAANAFPPGPNGEATASGPTGQAAAQTTNVNVVNTPTVNVGNVVTVKGELQEPLYYQKELDMVAGTNFADGWNYAPPAGKRLVLENVTVSCSSASAQSVGVGIYGPIPGGYPMLSFVPAVTAWGTGSVSTQTYPVHVLVDGTLSLSANRATQTGWTACVITLIGYLTPLA